MKPILFLLPFFMSLPVCAEVTLAPLFSDGAVLQRDKPVPVWGTAKAGEKITVTFADQKLSTTADAEGRWKVELAALHASGESRELVVKGENAITVKDVVVGEVWLASGQSNMEWVLSYCADAKNEIAAAHFPLVRQFKVPKVASFTPLATVQASWTPALPPTVGNFSGAAYYFARELHRRLNVPVGILNSAWGGTGVDAWISPEACKTTPALVKAFAQHEKGPRATVAEKADYESKLAAWRKARDEAKAARKEFKEAEPKAPPGTASSRTLTALYCGMIHPLVPYALRGAIWYQGESNVAHAAVYSMRFASLITGWRKEFGQGDFPFYWVQLPNFDHGGLNQTNWGWAELREAQTQTLAVPNTGQAITIDVGEAKGLHPKNKKSIGERLALIALARTYGVEGVVDRGPVFQSATRDGAAYRIAYEASSSPLKSAAAGLTGFELAGADKVFHPADARIDGATVLVSSGSVPDPVAVRYAYRNAPVAGLFNEAGLPAAPFRTDNWPAPTVIKPSALPSPPVEP